MELNIIYNEDCLDTFRRIPDKSIDLIVTDPPYGINFMGKAWDKALPDKKVWVECLRVLKDGAFAFVMSIPRADCLSRMIISLEDAGFNVGFTPIFWAYASGFPKAQNIGKAVDKRRSCDVSKYIIQSGKGDKEIADYCGVTPALVRFWRLDERQIQLKEWGKLKEFLDIENKQFDINLEDVEREIIGEGKSTLVHNNGMSGNFTGEINPKAYNITTPATPQAKALDGSYAGWQPKPSVEVIIVAMKPLSEKTYVDQALKNRKGITWLDEGRIPYESENDKSSIDRVIYGGAVGKPVINKTRKTGYQNTNAIFGEAEQLLKSQETVINPQGRFPANLLVSDDVLNQNGYNQKENNPNWRGGHYTNCLYCDKQFWVRPSLLERGQGKFCSDKCRSDYHSDWMRNENNPKWTGGHSYEYKKGKTGKEWKEKRLAVYKRDDFTCQLCGDKSGDLEAHHKIPWRFTQDDSIDNLISLCSHCHTTIEAYWKKLTPETQWISEMGVETLAESFSRYFSLDKWFEERIKQLPKSVQKTFPFLLVSKASKSEKNKGCEDMPDNYDSRIGDGVGGSPSIQGKRASPQKNNHPTVKPLKLMSYLITLGSREGDTVLDPFMGSGTTALACIALNRHYIGSEINKDYYDIAIRRIEVAQGSLCN